MNSDNTKITVQIVEDGMITVPIADYNLLLDHDTRLQVIREKAMHAIDAGEYTLCSDTFLRAALGLLNYTKPSKPEAEDKDE